jgi:TolB-like protein
MNYTLRHALVVVFSVVVMTALNPVPGWAAEKEVVRKDIKPDQAKNIHQVSRSLARELLDGLNVRPIEKKGWDKFVEKSLWTIKNLSDKKNPPPKKSDHRKIAVWPFWKNELRISKDFARAVSESVLAELVRGTISYNRFIARDELTKLTQDIDDFNSLRNSAEKINKLMRNAGADAIITAQIRPVNSKNLGVSYKAVEVGTGVILAQTRYHALVYDFDVDKALTINDAIKASAAYFAKELGSIQTVRPQGMHYQDTGVQTTFGRWFAKRFTGELNRTASGNGNSIKIADAILKETEIRRRGLRLSERTADSIMTENPTGDYVFGGEYWDLGKTIDLQVSMTGGDGKRKTWQGNVRRKSVPKELTLRPKKVFTIARENDGVGPIVLSLSSSRGKNPVFQLGQKMVLFIETSRDSYLYCFYRQANGKLMKIFPNRHHKSAFIAGSSLRSIPDKTMKFDWVVEPPLGTELVKCYAFDRNVSADLPKAIREIDFKSLPYQSLDGITRALRQIKNAAIAENSMVVNVEK